MKWIAVERNYHGTESKLTIRWVVIRDGALRGVCECWDPESAELIASALNALSGVTN